MEQHEQIIRWIARGVVAIYLLRLAVDLTGWPVDELRRRQRERGLRYLWTAAFGLHVLHVVLAFAWIHHWSQAAAWEETAQRTGNVVGWYWGGGLWINYLFTVAWLVDIAISWRWGLDGLSRRYRLLVHGVVAFMLINATVVFGPPVWKWAILPVGILFAALVAWLRGDRR